MIMPNYLVASFILCPVTDSLVRRTIDASVQRLSALRPTRSRVEPGAQPVETRPLSASPVYTSEAQGRPQAKNLERDPIREAELTIDRVSKGNVPIIAGPFSSEVGYELLYWIPFLRWMTTRAPELKKNLIVVSRGGTADWYSGIGERYQDIFSFFDPETYATRRQEGLDGEKRHRQKQYELSPLDQEIVERVASTQGLSEYRLLHPSVMYDELRQLSKRFAHARFEQVARYEPFAMPPLGELEGKLPDNYVAVKFYFNFPLGQTEQVRSIIGSIIRELARQTDVVLLNTGMQVDDHLDFDLEATGRILRVDRLMTPVNNLRLQTAVISRARAFVGTYGGLSYLPPFFGVPSLNFYSDRMKFSHHHLSLAQRVFRGDGWGSFVALDINEASLLRLVQGAFASPPDGASG